MTVVELIQAFGRDSPVGILVTDACFAPPGPIIQYANAALGQLVGRDPAEIVGQSPRFMHGKETRRTTLDAFHRALQAGERFHGYLTNYRADGTKYQAEIDCRPLCNASGVVEHFVAFEREVVRRVGRPIAGLGGRYQLLSVSNTSLTGALQLLAIFEDG